jgi:hypothetical protein
LKVSSNLASYLLLGQLPWLYNSILFTNETVTKLEEEFQLLKGNLTTDELYEKIALRLHFSRDLGINDTVPRSFSYRPVAKLLRLLGITIIISPPKPIPCLFGLILKLYIQPQISPSMYASARI